MPLDGRHLLGYRPDSRDPRDYPAAPLFKMATPPPTASMAAWRSPIKDQGPEGSCTTFGLERGVRTVLRRDAPQFDFDWSNQQLYNSARILNGSFDQDAGLTLRDLMKAAQTIGVGHSELWPYDPANLFTAPPQDVLDDAFQYKVQKYHNITNSREMKLAIASGFPVVFGIALYNEWDSVGPTGFLPMPALDAQLIGYHCMCADEYEVGMPGCFTVPNQYGIDWGHGGLTYIPYSYFDSAARMIFAIVVDVFGSAAEYSNNSALGQKGLPK